MADDQSLPVATALVEALTALAKASAAVTEALALVKSETPAPVTRKSAVVRTTSTQVLAVLAAAQEPLTLIDIADGVVALRRGEDEPRLGGGTRYQELCRSSIARLIERGVIHRVPPADRRGLMKFSAAPSAPASGHAGAA